MTALPVRRRREDASSGLPSRGRPHPRAFRRDPFSVWRNSFHLAREVAAAPTPPEEKDREWRALGSSLADHHLGGAGPRSSAS
jgi:hypothetical protein